MQAQIQNISAILSFNRNGDPWPILARLPRLSKYAGGSRMKCDFTQENLAFRRCRVFFRIMAW